MLDHEYGLVVEAPAIAIAARTRPSLPLPTPSPHAASHATKKATAGWASGSRPRPAANHRKSIIHVHLRGKKSIQDQESLGIVGVNLIYGAFYHHNEPELLMETLLDGLNTELRRDRHDRVLGHAFADIDNRLMALRLVQKGLAPSAMFTADGRVVHPAEALYKKAVLIERSRFRPPTHLNMNMLDCARAQFIAEREVQDNEVLVISEMTLHNLRDGNDIDVRDFLHRVEILCALGEERDDFRPSANTTGWPPTCSATPKDQMGVVMGLPTSA